MRAFWVLAFGLLCGSAVGLNDDFYGPGGDDDGTDDGHHNPNPTVTTTTTATATTTDTATSITGTSTITATTVTGTSTITATTTDTATSITGTSTITATTVTGASTTTGPFVTIGPLPGKKKSKNKISMALIGGIAGGAGVLILITVAVILGRRRGGYTQVQNFELEL